MIIQTFIEKAIEGGFSSYAKNVAADQLPLLDAVAAIRREFSYTQVLLDPLAWQAVGKMEGWDLPLIYKGTFVRKMGLRNWFVNMHRMIDALADGKTIEQFLETLT